MIQTYVLWENIYTVRQKKRRTSFYDMKRMEWSIHVEELLAERGDTFSQFFLMEHDSFTTLCDIINSDVQVLELLGVLLLLR